jgi:hypothetical protein
VFAGPMSLSMSSYPALSSIGRHQRPRRISSALSHSGSCTRSMKRHLSPQLPHKTDLPSGSARPLAVRLNSLTSDRCSVCWQALMRRLSTPGGRVTLRRRRQRCVEVGAALRTEVKIPLDSIVVELVQAAGWAAQCVTDRRAGGYEYAEDHEEPRHLERGVMLEVEIGECPETESA